MNYHIHYNKNKKNLQFSQKQEIYEKEKGNDDSFDDLFLKTLEKNDLDYLKQSLLKFNLKESINDTISSKKYNVKDIN